MREVPRVRAGLVRDRLADDRRWGDVRLIAARDLSVGRLPGGPWGQNCYVVSTEGGDAVVVDPGGGADRVAEHLDANGLRLHAVLATHAHHDHVGAASELLDSYDVPFAVHSGDDFVLKRLNLARFALSRLEPVPVPPIDIDLAEVTRLRFAALDAKVLHTPGHTPGSVCFEIGGALFTGDTLLSAEPGRTDFPGGDSRALRASIAGLTDAYPPRTPLLPGHGEPGALADAVAELPAREEEPSS